MRYKVNKLFDDSQTKKRVSAEQDEFERNHLELLMDAYEAFNEAFKLMLEEKGRHKRLYRNKNWPANTLNGFAVGLIYEKHPSYMKPDNGSFIYMGRKAIIKFKKLNDNYLPDNVKTRKVTLERTQRAFLEEVDWPIIYVGYRLNRSFTEIVGYYAVCVDNWNNLLWITDLEELYNRQFNNERLIQPVSPTVSPARTLVRVKAGKQRRVNE